MPIPVEEYTKKQEPGLPPKAFKPAISVGNKVAPQNNEGLAQQQVQQAALRGVYGGKRMKKGSKKETEKNENKEWDTGFGELYEKIEDRRVKRLFSSMDELLEKR